MNLNDVSNAYYLVDVQNEIIFETLKRNNSSHLYIVQTVFSVQDKFDVSLFSQACRLVLNRHEILRSAIVIDPIQSKQVIYENVELPISFYDYSVKQDKQKLYELFLQDDLQINFDITKPPLMRFSYIKLSNNEHRLVWTRHYILIDAYSADRLIEEIFNVYFRLLNNSNYELPAIDYAYGNIRPIIDSFVTDSHRDFWKKSLNDFSNVVFLPHTPVECSTSQNIQRLNCFYDEIDYLNLVGFVKKNKLTIDTMLQAAWGIILSNFSGKNNSVIGVVKSYSEYLLIDSIGLFTNTLPIYLNASPNQIVIDYLKDIKNKNILLVKNIFTPLSKIKEWCELSPEITLYQSIIDYKQSTVDKNKLEILSFKANIPCPLVLEVIDDNNSLIIQLSYDQDLFENEYAKSILQHFKHILKILIIHSNDTLEKLPILAVEDYKKIIIDWNDTQRGYPNDQPIHKLFEEQVKKTPHATAVVDADFVLTYQELNQKANQLACYLIKQGITPSKLVGICVKPNLDMMISILAVLKIGCAYVPIDSNYPKERMAHVLNESKPSAIIVHSTLCNLIDDVLKRSLFKMSPQLIDIDILSLHDYETTNLDLEINLNDLMYVIFTSGSTGSPKGVQVEHASVVSMAFACIERLKISNKSRILQLASFSFDVMVAEWCLTLISGASLYLIDKDIFSPNTIWQALEQHKITTIILASSILASLPKKPLPNLKVVAVGGEPVAHAVVDFWAPGRSFLNVYGITETTICSTMADCYSKQRDFTIGKPLPNTKIYILNEAHQPVPIYGVGTIYIGGRGVARGYLNNLELTNKKFIANPFLAENQDICENRLYETGDLGRWLPTGEIEFLGRRDNQVKIRGLRIELLEIEKTLEKHPEIDNAIVLVNPISGHEQLYAYILTKNDNIDILEIRQFLTRYLPHYMLPSQIIKIDKFPLTPHGKIDKQKMLSFKPKAIFSNNEIILGNKWEEIILDIIQRILHHPVSITQNFMSMGLHSMMLVQIALELSQEIGQQIDITILFNYTTIESLAKYLSLIEKKVDKSESYIKFDRSQTHLGKNKRIIFSDE